MSQDQRPPGRRLGTRRAVARPVVGPNPLKRKIDTTERRLHKLMVLIGILLLPVVIVPGVLIWHTRDTTPQIVTYPVVAVTDSSTSPITPIQSTIGDDTANKVPAHWTFRGDEKSGVIAVMPGTSVGSKVMISVDANGNPRPAVPVRADAAVTAVMVMVILFGVLMASLIAAMTWVRHRYDRKRDAMWDDAIMRFFN